jgi:hypothetical protein
VLCYSNGAIFCFKNLEATILYNGVPFLGMEEGMSGMIYQIIFGEVYS